MCCKAVRSAPGRAPRPRLTALQTLGLLWRSWPRAVLRSFQFKRVRRSMNRGLCRRELVVTLGVRAKLVREAGGASTGFCELSFCTKGLLTRTAAPGRVPMAVRSQQRRNHGGTSSGSRRRSASGALDQRPARADQVLAKRQRGSTLEYKISWAHGDATWCAPTPTPPAFQR